MTGSCVCVCVCARQSWTKERDVCWQVHSAVKAPLFNSQTQQHLCYWSIQVAETLKVCPWQFGEVLSLQSGPECWVNAQRLSRLSAPLRSLTHCTRYLSPFFLPPSCPLSLSSLPPLSVYYSSEKWQQGRPLCMLKKEIHCAPLLMPDLLFVWEKLWWRKKNGWTIGWKR